MLEGIFQGNVISAMFFFYVEAATTGISDILYFFGQGNFIFIREKSGNFVK